jgi:hypothetical protein
LGETPGQGWDILPSAWQAPGPLVEALGGLPGGSLAVPPLKLLTFSLSQGSPVEQTPFSFLTPHLDWYSTIKISLCLSVATPRWFYIKHCHLCG